MRLRMTVLVIVAAAGVISLSNATGAGADAGPTPTPGPVAEEPLNGVVEASMSAQTEASTFAYALSLDGDIVVKLDSDDLVLNPSFGVAYPNGGGGGGGSGDGGTPTNTRLVAFYPDLSAGGILSVTVSKDYLSAGKSGRFKLGVYLVTPSDIYSGDAVDGQLTETLPYATYAFQESSLHSIFQVAVENPKVHKSSVIVVYSLPNGTTVMESKGAVDGDHFRLDLTSGSIDLTKGVQTYHLLVGPSSARGADSYRVRLTQFAPSPLDAKPQSVRLSAETPAAAFSVETTANQKFSLNVACMSEVTIDVYPGGPGYGMEQDRKPGDQHPMNFTITTGGTKYVVVSLPEGYTGDQADVQVSLNSQQ